MSVFDRTFFRCALVLAVTSLPWMLEAVSGCVPSGACLRNTDCSTGTSCHDGECVILGRSAARTAVPDAGLVIDAAGFAPPVPSTDQ